MTCPFCGLPGTPHAKAQACITALRKELAIARTAFSELATPGEFTVVGCLGLWVVSS